MSQVPPAEPTLDEPTSDGAPPVADGAPPPSVPLPPRGSGERRARRSQRRRRSDRRRWRLLALVAAGVLVGAALVAFAVWLLAQSDESPSDRATATSEAGAGAVAPLRALLVQRGTDGGVVGVTAIAVDEGGSGGDVVLAPVGTMVEVPSFGLTPLREAFELGGVDLLRQAVENLLGVAFDQVAVVGPDELAALVAPAGALTVELPSAVEAVSPEGRVATLFRAGPVTVAPADVPALLEARGTGTDLDRLVRHQAFWRSWLAAVADDPGAAPPAEAADGLGAVVPALAGGSTGYHLLPVEVLASGTGSSDDLYAVRRDELPALLARTELGAGEGVGDRIRVQLLNGVGAPGLAQRVQPALAPAGAVVTLTGNADRFDYEVTQVVFYRDEDLASARAVQRALGVGEVVRSLVPLDVVDVTVVVGADVLDQETTTTADPGA